MTTIKCRDCERAAQWYVWYEKTTLLIGDANIAYSYLCDEHKDNDVQSGRDGHRVIQVKPIEEDE